MKKTVILSLCLCLILSAAFIAMPKYITDAKSYSGTVYYVDNETGSDSNDGTSENTPWKSLENVNATTFNPGDAILLKRGCVWNDGWLWPKGSGTESDPITVSSYGDKSLSKPAIISKYLINMSSEKPSVNAAVYLANQSYVVIDGLDITNGSASGQYGVRILTRNGYYTYGCVIKNCRISGLAKYTDNWESDAQSDLTGIACLAENYWSFIGSLNIENNEIYNCKALGISVNGAYGGCNQYGEPYYQYSGRNVYIGGNYLQNIGKDGILVNNTISPVIEYNTCNRAHSYAKTSWHVAMWPFATYGALFQYNESYDTQTTYDGQGFDCDYQSYYTVFQYNYSHDNQGGFILICTEPANWDGGVAFNYNAKVRYNISQNDHHRTFCLTCHITDTEIYNNTIYVPSDVSSIIDVYSRDNIKYPINTVFSNNIFYVNGGSNYWGKSEGTVFTNNIYYGKSAGFMPQNDDEGGADDNITSSGNITADPLFVEAGGADIGRDSCYVYKLTDGSPALNSGVYVENNGGKDFFGNIVKEGAVNIGAYNGPAVDPENAAPTTAEQPTTAEPTAEPTTQPAEIIYGDANDDGKVTAADVLILRKKLANWQVIVNRQNADVNFDNKITAADVLLLRKHIARWKVAPWD